MSFASGYSKRIIFTQMDETDLSLEQVVEPHNDYFSTQFLVCFPFVGNLTVNIFFNLMFCQVDKY